MANPVKFGEGIAQMRAAIERLAAFSETPEGKAAIAKWEAEQGETVSVEKAHKRRRQGIPEIFWPHLAAPRDTEAFKAVWRFAESRLSFCVLLGEAGLGKSLAMAWLVDREGGQFVEATRLAREGYFDDDVTDALIACHVLALDELGMEAMDGKGFYLSKLFQVLNARFQSGKRTLLAGNLTPAEFKSRYASDQLTRLWDRIEHSSVRVVLRGASMRRPTP
jgi:hypothetical protein